MLANLRKAAKYMGTQLEVAYREHAEPKVLEHQRREEARAAARAELEAAAEARGRRASMAARRDAVAARIAKLRADAARATAAAEAAEATGEPNAEQLRSSATVLTDHVATLEAELAAIDETIGAGTGSAGAIDPDMLAEHHARIAAIAANTSADTAVAAKVAVELTDLDPGAAVRAAQDVLAEADAKTRLAEIRDRLNVDGP